MEINASGSKALEEISYTDKKTGQKIIVTPTDITTLPEKQQQRLISANTEFANVVRNLNSAPLGNGVDKPTATDIYKMMDAAKNVSLAIYKGSHWEGPDMAKLRILTFNLYSPVEIGSLVSMGLRLGSKWRRALARRGAAGLQMYSFLQKFDNDPKRKIYEGNPEIPSQITLPRMVICWPDLALTNGINMILNPIDGDRLQVLEESREQYYVTRGLPSCLQVLGLSDLVPRFLVSVYTEFSVEVGIIISGGIEDLKQKSQTINICDKNVGKYRIVNRESILQFLRAMWTDTNEWGIEDFMIEELKDLDPGKVRSTFDAFVNDADGNVVPDYTSKGETKGRKVNNSVMKGLIANSDNNNSKSIRK